jgi:hypothetical protein
VIQVEKVRDLRTLVFDFETKPGAYWYDDTTTTLVCAWAAKFVGEDRVDSVFMVPDWLAPWANSHAGTVSVTRRVGMLQFLALWDQADQVVTHNGKRFDLPIIQGALDRLNLPRLAPKTHIDTLSDRVKSRGVKRSLEALAERYELPDEKQGVSSEVWERAYEFEPQAIATVIERAESDVVVTEQLYLESINRGVLR